MDHVSPSIVDKLFRISTEWQQPCISQCHIAPMRRKDISCQRYCSAVTKFAHVESRFCGCKRRGEATFDVPINPCVRAYVVEVRCRDILVVSLISRAWA